MILGCGRTQAIRLGDVSPRFSELSGTNLDPLGGKPKEIPNTGLPKYDGFFRQANKTLLTLQIGEKVVDSAYEKKNAGKDISQEMEAAIDLEEELPALIAGMAILEATGRDLLDNIQTDLSGSNQRHIPVVGQELDRIASDLAEYSVKAPKIFADISRLRRDGNNFSAIADSLVPRDSLDSNPDMDRENSTEPKEPIAEEKPKEPKKSKKDSSDSDSEKFKLASPSIRNLPGNFSPRSTKREDSDEVLTPEQIKEKEYSRKVEAGLLDVFRAEAARNTARLSQLALGHEIPRVRAAGAYALGRLGQGRVTLEKIIDTDGFVVRTAAFKSLAQIGDRKSLSYFLEGIKSSDPEIKAASFLGLGKTKEPVGRGLILGRGLTSELILVIGESLKGLGYYQVPADLDIIRKYLAVDERDLQLKSIEALTIHNTPESLKVLEESLTEYPKLSMEILESIGKSPDLAATFFLVKASQLYEDERILNRVGQLLLKRKAFGVYGMVLVEQDFIRKEPNERSQPTGKVELSDIGLVLKNTPKRYVVRIGDELVEDTYRQLKFENKLQGARDRYVSGWIFGKKIQMIAISKPSSGKPARLENVNTGKHQNLFEPGKPAVK